MPAPSPERLRDELTRLLHRDGTVREFSLAAGRALARAVPFDGLCVLTLDPATLLPTGEVVEHGLPAEATARMAEIEIRGHDVNGFSALARAPRHAATLSQATGGDLERSLRHREVRGPNGFGDELRAALVDDATAWGALTLLRSADRPSFSPGDATLVAGVAQHLAEGLRRALISATPSTRTEVSGEAVGWLVLAADNTIAHADRSALAWLAELDEPGQGRDVPPTSVISVANRARGIARGPTAGAVARVRVRTAAGHWLRVRGSSIGTDDQAVVTLEPASPHELAPLIAGAYALTPRERVVTQLVAQGLSTTAIAERLHLSPWTIQDHLKAIFEKADVSTRGELVARLFFEHYVPRLNTPESWDCGPGTAP
jgi:DNA-binding CsgD family transcriptional regulator